MLPKELLNGLRVDLIAMLLPGCQGPDVGFAADLLLWNSFPKKSFSFAFSDQHGCSRSHEKLRAVPEGEVGPEAPQGGEVGGEEGIEETLPLHKYMEGVEGVGGERGVAFAQS